MPIGHEHNRAVLVFNILSAVFLLAAVYHIVQKPDLPESLSLAPSRSHIRSLNGDAVATSDEIEFVLSSCRIGDEVQVEFEFPEGTVSKAMRLVPYSAPSYIAIDVVAALTIFLLGLFVYFKRPGEDASTVFNLAASTTAVAMLGMKTIYTIQPAWLGSTLCVLFFFAYTIIPILFLHFTFVFPVVRWRQFRRFLHWLYLVGAVFATWQSWVYLRAGRLHSLGTFHASSTAILVGNAFAFLIFLLSVSNFFYSYKKAIASSEKKKLRWMLLGLCVGPSPFIFLWVLPQALGIQPQIPEVVFKLFLLLIPVTFAVSILKYHVMDIDVIINRSAVYVIVVGVLLSVYVVVVGFFATVIKAPSIYVSSAVAVLVALAFEPFRRAVQQFVDRKFFRVLYNYRQVVRKFVEEVNKCLDVQQLAELIVSRIQDIIPVERVGFFSLRQPGPRLQLVAHQHFDMLERHGVPFEAKQLKTDLRQTLAVSESVEPGIAYEPVDSEVFRRWGMALVCPMLSESSEILGFLVLGSKKSGARFTVEDADLLSTVTLQAGLTIERVALQQQLLLKQEEAKRLEELNQLKSYFVSSVSHDLKTPLTSIKMFAELLGSKKSVRGKNAESYLEIIGGEADRLTRLINNVLDFAGMERGVKEYHFGDVLMNETVRGVLQSMAYQLKIGKFSVRVDLSKREFTIRADADAVAEAIINLLSNAMKYSSEKKMIDVSTSLSSGFATVSVKDYGLGIPEDKLESIFDPFYRVSGRQTERVGGVGLGLSIVKHIMDAHGGRVDVQTAVGKGSTFALMFALKES